VLVLMAIGSPTHPAPAEMWEQWCKPYNWGEYQGQQMVNFGPLFGHQYSHIWVDFRGIKDPYMRKKGIDYFENSRRATLAHRQYCIANPFKFKGYGENIWGLTACDGPADRRKEYEGREIQFHTYSARGVAIDYHSDDGTIAPTAVGGSVPFAPEVCLPALEAMWNRWPVGPYGFYDAYNETYTWGDANHPSQPGQPFWVDLDYLGIDQGPIVLMIENHRSGFIWNLMKKNPYIVAGLKKAGFSGGWLDATGNQPPVANSRPAKSQAPVAGSWPKPMEPESFFRRDNYVDAAGGVLPYQLLEPWKAKKGVKYPLVVFLHGSGERGRDNSKQMRNGVFSFVEQQTREKHPCYLLVPQCPEDSLWSTRPRGDDWSEFDAQQGSTPGRQVLELIDKLIKENPSIDRSRIYLTGLSMGGFGTFDLLMRRPELFAAGLPLCGGGDTDEVARIRQIPLWIVHGALDPAVPVRYSRTMLDALRKAGASPKYTEYSTLDHFIWNETYYNPAVLDWLFAQRKKQ
jgi:predicted esterase